MMWGRYTVMCFWNSFPVWRERIYFERVWILKWCPALLEIIFTSETADVTPAGATQAVRYIYHIMYIIVIVCIKHQEACSYREGDEDHDILYNIVVCSIPQLLCMLMHSLNLNLWEHRWQSFVEKTLRQLNLRIHLIGKEWCAKRILWAPFFFVFAFVHI